MKIYIITEIHPQQNQEITLTCWKPFHKATNSHILCNIEKHLLIYIFIENTKNHTKFPSRFCIQNINKINGILNLFIIQIILPHRKGRSRRILIPHLTYENKWVCKCSKFKSTTSYFKGKARLPHTILKSTYKIRDR